ncbi:NADH-dependent flavin oxidoreductase [Schizosaccharomyces japonicus yFS275]|uniref:NADH-dependent flavin oxidoreductase n=1 Tax=Schizosaccharomyces japonicus (strain yFS275 / FY16936) TaxID=402676 RepID=B6JYK7_SCHJY|nr:NADH-dependent flavin oxidoreductase [Schizosaccharomyces japonicus yFS275]EEB06625.1 NADH-dependent flavin oxidoreductase [Schizosaccharomyces japonicus yFS275]
MSGLPIGISRAFRRLQLPKWSCFLDNAIRTSAPGVDAGRLKTFRIQCCYSSSSIQNDFRAAMQRYPQPVVIVTSVDSNGRTSGMTVSSFCAVSLSSSEPVVSFNVRLPSHTASAIDYSKQLVAHTLSGCQITHAQWAQLLSKPSQITPKASNRHETSPQRARDATKQRRLESDVGGGPSTSSIVTSETERDRFLRLKTKRNENGIPCLAHTLHLLHCHVIRSLDVDDHRIYIAGVHLVERGQYPIETSRGLVYYNRQFCSTIPMNWCTENEDKQEKSHT